MNNIEVDNRAVLAMFAELDEKRRKQVYRATLNASANILVKQTKSNLRGVVSRTKTKNKWNGKTLESGVKKKISRDAREAEIHIMGDFRLRFFEKGTKDRHTKGRKITGSFYVGKRKYASRTGKGGNRGRIAANYFFRAAKQSTERQIFNEMDNTLSRYIQKINEKYKEK